VKSRTSAQSRRRRTLGAPASPPAAAAGGQENAPAEAPGARRVSVRLLLSAAVLLAAGPAFSGAGPVAWLQTYLSFDTSNPPGDERPAVE